jgi:uncharacterized protein DUF4326
MPTRIQRCRTPGWTAPLDAHGRTPVHVGRGTRWGNPARLVRHDNGWSVDQDHGGSVGVFPDEHTARRFAVDVYRHRLGRDAELLAAVREYLAGRDLMCWCALVDADGRAIPCHADVLLEAAADPS